MYIRSIQLQGFKSFLNKTKIELKPGLTSIVGPNGCGKSNIVDAIRWVLGEQKKTRLRTDIKEDVIFNGTDKIKPTNYAEVKLVIKNNSKTLPIEYTDIEIKRRLFRTGDNEYFINKTKCRLKDIQEMFINTGMSSDAYSVIELKMIDEILNENLMSLKKMIDSAAGISNYNKQRTKTLTKIKNVTLDLTRINDIVIELRKNIKYLDSQMKQFNEHESLMKKLENYEAKLSQIRINNILDKINVIEKSLNADKKKSKLLYKDISISESKITKYQLLLDEKRQELLVTKKELSNSNEQLLDINSKLIKFSEKQKYNSSQIDYSSDQISQIISSIKHSDTKLKELIIESKKLQKLIDKNEKEIILFKKKYSADFKAKENLLEKIDQQATKIESIYNEKLLIENKITSLDLKKENHSKHLFDLKSYKYDKNCKFCIENGKKQINETDFFKKKLKKINKELNGYNKKLSNTLSKYKTELKKSESLKSSLKLYNSKNQIVNDKFHDLEIDKIKFTKEIESIEYRLNYFKDSKEELSIKKNTLNTQIELLKSEINDINHKQTNISNQRTVLNDKLNNLKLDIDKKETKYDDINAKIKESQNIMSLATKNSEHLNFSIQQKEIEISNLNNEIKIINNFLKDKYSSHISDYNFKNIKLTKASIINKINKIKIKIEDYGPINMNVKNQFYEENERFEFLNNQKLDLEKSKKMLNKTINKLNKEAKSNFIFTFNMINKNLKETFPMFFKGGTAKLILSDQDNPLESNIIIAPSPPGKKVKKLNVLSAGEKALTAISILFAIYQKKPSPFCVLDEVDAPLDDFNTKNFTDVLKLYSKKTQFIIVTHNKLTMNSSDLLYGVTQEDKGISKILSVNLND